MGGTDMLCDLQYAAGRIERCPGAGCPFFGERGCALAGLRADLSSNLPLTYFLLDLRRQTGGETETPSLFGFLPGLAA
jgi:hypothetical protein